MEIRRLNRPCKAPCAICGPARTRSGYSVRRIRGLTLRGPETNHRMKKIAALLAAGLSLAAASTAAAETPQGPSRCFDTGRNACPATASSARARFDGHVSGAATGPGHSFVVGDGLNLVFRDYRRSYTRYRVCWTRGHGTRCWRRTTGKRGHASTIFTAAPGNVGTYVVTWSVRGRAVARWSFYNGVGD